ncbi:MAG: Flp pilus assembly protein CpaB [Gemmatimonadota bacterium]
MKRKRRKWMALVMALVSGGTAGYLAMNYLGDRSNKPAVAGTPGQTPVVVAAQRLELGSVVGPGDVKIVEWPSSNVPVGYATSPEQVVGRGVIQPVMMNEPLLTSKLAQKGEGGGLPIVIPEGMRGVSVKVDEVIGVAGFVLPGTRVDVLVTINPNNDAEEATTRVILQNVRVLTAGQMIQKDAEGTPQTVTVITLLVTPEESEELTLAATEGRIHLALRNTLDMAEVQTEGVKAGELVKTVEPVNTAPRVRRSGAPRRSGTTIVTFNGTERSETTF